MKKHNMANQTGKHCEVCGKSLPPDNKNCIGLEQADGSEKMFDFCLPCGTKVVEALLIIEHAQQPKGVLQA